LDLPSHPTIGCYIGLGTTRVPAYSRSHRQRWEPLQLRCTRNSERLRYHGRVSNLEAGAGVRSRGKAKSCGHWLWSRADAAGTAKNRGDDPKKRRVCAISTLIGQNSRGKSQTVHLLFISGTPSIGMGGPHSARPVPSTGTSLCAPGLHHSETQRQPPG
jgi:hypothetical protein